MIAGGRERLKYALFASRAKREWDALEHFYGRGVSGPRPLAFGEKRRGLTLLQMGAMVGVHQTTIDKYEGGQVPRAEHARKIYEVTDGSVTPCSFLGIKCACELAAEEAEKRRQAAERQDAAA